MPPSSPSFGNEIARLGFRMSDIKILINSHAHYDHIADAIPPVPGLDGPLGIGTDECGNLYVADPAEHRFWMQGVLVPLDIAFFDGDGRWLAHYGFGAFDQPTLSGGVGARA